MATTMMLGTILIISTDRGLAENLMVKINKTLGEKSSGNEIYDCQIVQLTNLPATAREIAENKVGLVILDAAIAKNQSLASIQSLRETRNWAAIPLVMVSREMADLTEAVRIGCPFLTIIADDQRMDFVRTLVNSVFFPETD